MSIEKCLSNPDFLSLARNLLAKRRTLLNKMLYDATVKQLSHCGIAAPRFGSSEWYKVYKLILRLVSGSEQRPQESRARVITPAAAIYAAVYELYGYDASQKMYELLEDMVTDALRGGRRDIRLLFYPVGAAPLSEQFKVIAEVLRRAPELCGTRSLPELLCSVSVYTDVRGRRQCLLMLRRVCGAVRK